jgi:hypothetical protein
MLASTEGILPRQPGKIICGQDVCYLRFMTHAPSVTENSSLSDTDRLVASMQLDSLLPVHAYNIVEVFRNTVLFLFVVTNSWLKCGWPKDTLKHLVHKHFCPESPSILR